MVVVPILHVGTSSNHARWRFLQTAQPLVQQPKDDGIKQVPLVELFHFADAWDWMLMFWGTMAGIATGMQEVAIYARTQIHPRPFRPFWTILSTCPVI